MAGSLEKAELQEVLQRGQVERDEKMDVERIGGLGYGAPYVIYEMILSANMHFYIELVCSAPRHRDLGVEYEADKLKDVPALNVSSDMSASAMSRSLPTEACQTETGIDRGSSRDYVKKAKKERKEDEKRERSERKRKREKRRHDASSDDEKSENSRQMTKKSQRRSRIAEHDYHRTDSRSGRRSTSLSRSKRDRRVDSRERSYDSRSEKYDRRRRRSRHRSRD
jgi:hypothetical protein